MMLLKGSKKKR